MAGWQDAPIVGGGAAAPTSPAAAAPKAAWESAPIVGGAETANLAPSPTGSTTDKIIGVESGGSASARNPNSSAGGLGQFIDSTWLSSIRKAAPEFAGLSDDELLAKKTDASPEGVALQKRVLQSFTDENRAGLTDAGIQPTDANVYLAHFLGLGGAKKALAADPNASVASVLGDVVVRANPFLKSKSIGQLQRWAERKMGGSTEKLYTIDPKAEGLLAPGNVDLNSRVIFRGTGDDGGSDYRTENSISIGTDAGEVLIPTVVNGKQLSEADAIEHFEQTGENLGTFATPDAADAYAEKLHERQGARYAPPSRPPDRNMAAQNFTGDFAMRPDMANENLTPEQIAAQQSFLGDNPGFERANLLPMETDTTTGARRLAVPGMITGLLNGIGDAIQLPHDVLTNANGINNPTIDPATGAVTPYGKEVIGRALNAALTSMPAEQFPAKFGISKKDALRIFADKQAAEFDIPLTKGQGTGEVKQLQREETLRQVDGSAKKIIQGFDEGQREAIRKAASRIGADLGAGADDMGHTVLGAVSKVVADTRSGAKDKFDQAFGSNLMVKTEALGNLPSVVSKRLSDDGVLIDTSGPGSVTPVAAFALKQIEEAQKIIDGLRPAAPAAGTAEKTIESKGGTTYLDTRGGGAQFHGSSSPITQFDEGHYNSSNIYGNGFYTTDAADAAAGYTRKGKGDAPIIYKVEEKAPVRLADMDAPISSLPDDIRKKITQDDDMLETAYSSLGKADPSLREVLDELRTISSGEGWSRDTVHEAFDGLRENLSEAGFGGMTHIGGSNTGTAAHKVKIYFEPQRDLKLSPTEIDTLKPTPPKPNETEVTLRAVEEIRRRLVRLQGAGSEDATAVRAIKEGFDDWYDDTVDRMLITGDDKALQTLKEARSQWKDYKNLTTAKPGDAAQASVVKMQREDATAEEVGRWLYGADIANPSLEAPKVAARIKRIVGEDTPAWSAVRASAWDRLVTDLKADDVRSAKMIAQRIRQFAGKDGSTLSKVLFTKDERFKMERFATVLDRTVTRDDVANRSRSGHTIMGALKNLTGLLAGVAGTTVGGPGVGVTAALAVPVFKGMASNAAARSAIRSAGIKDALNTDLLRNLGATGARGAAGIALPPPEPDNAMRIDM